MFKDDAILAMEWNVHSLTRAIMQRRLEGQPDNYAEINILGSIQMWSDWLSRSTHYYLQVEQARHFQSAKFMKRGLPSFPHDHIFVEFDGLLTFDYVIPTLEMGYEDREGMLAEGLINKKDTRYKGVLIAKIPPQHKFRNIPQGEQAFEAIWFEPPVPHPTDSRRTLNDWYCITWSESSWPKLLSDDESEEHKTAHLKFVEDMKEGVANGAQFEAKVGVGLRESKEHAYRLFRMTVNLLYFLTSENQTFVRMRPESRAKGMPKARSGPYLFRPMHYHRYRYLVEGDRGHGTKHSYRYDVKGHFRHLEDERYERNDDGTVRVIWVEPHQRGLENVEYKPPLMKVGKIGQRVLEFDSFQQSVESRLRKRMERKVAR